MNHIHSHIGREHYIIGFLTGIVIGLLLAKQGIYISLYWTVFGIGLLFWVRRNALLILAAVVGLGCVLGVVRGASVHRKLLQYDQFVGQSVEVEGRVVNDVRYTDRKQRQFLVNGIELNGQKLPGFMRVETYEAIGVQRGDYVRISGTLRDGFGSYQARLSYAAVEPLSRSGNPVERIRRLYFASVYSTIPEPQASLGLGFLVGLRALLPDALLDSLSVTGLTHIVAVSGFNLTVIIRLAKRLFARRSRFQALVISFGLLGGFLLVTGAAASIVRASVVSSLVLIGWYFGRTISPTMVLIVSATTTALANPMFLWFDLGWWLSFLAFFGVLIVAPVLRQYVIRRELGFFGSIALETTSAQLTTMPLIVHVFGQMSVVALLANMIVLPLVPIAMLLTFIAGSAGLWVPGLAGWLSWPATQLLTYITSVVDLLAGVPGALLKVSISHYEMYAFYACTVLIVLAVHMRHKPELKSLL